MKPNLLFLVSLFVFLQRFPHQLNYQAIGKKMISIINYLFLGNANDASGNNLNDTVIDATQITDKFSCSNGAYNDLIFYKKTEYVFMLIIKIDNYERTI